MQRNAKLHLNAPLVLAVCGVCSVPALAQEPDPVKQRLESSPRHHEWVEIKTPAGRTVRAFLVFPEVDKPALAVIVIHENRGLTDWERNIADQLAEAGFVALAPDLLSQTGPDGGGTDSYASRDAAREGIYKLSAAQVLADLDACAAHLRTLDAVNKKVAVAGFCWGGSQTFAYAVHSPDIAAACVFYGSAPAEETDLAKIRAPVYGFYGENDHRITAQVPKVVEQMKNAGKVFEPVTYPGAGHGFMRSGEQPGADAANRDARDQAWTRWISLLQKLESDRGMPR